MNLNEIKKVLAQRYPFLLIDKIIAIDENSITGIKNVSATDPYLVGHFPEEPLYPGVLLIESCSQVGGVYLSKKLEEVSNGYLAQVNDFKFLGFIEPGDTIIIKAKFISFFGSYAKMETTAFVKDRKVAKGAITYYFTTNKGDK